MATTTQQAAARYLSEKRATGTISRKTEKDYRRVLGSFVDLCPTEPGKITSRDTVRWLRTISHVSQATRRVYVSTAGGFCGWLADEGMLRKDPFARMAPLTVPRPIHRALDAEQVARLIAACESRRDHVMLLLALHTGLRRAELAALEVGDISLAARTLLVRHGKGGHSRLLPLSDEAARVVGGYMAHEALKAGPLLRSLSQPERGIEPDTVGTLFRSLAYRSGVKVRAGDGVATHATRHTCATDTHRATKDVLVVQALLGHSQLSTTQRYIADLDIDQLRTAVEGRRYLGPAA